MKSEVEHITQKVLSLNQTLSKEARLSQQEKNRKHALFLSTSQDYPNALENKKTLFLTH